MPEAGAKVFVVADRDAMRAQEVAAEIGQQIYGVREALAPRFVSIDEALDRALAAQQGPTVLADVADNAGGGAASDATFILERVLDRGVRNVVSALHWEPIAVRACQDAGEGAEVDLQIGGKSGRTSGNPLKLRATVRRVASGLTQRFNDSPIPIGDAAWVEVDGVHLVLNTRRTQVFHPECMTALGINLAQFHIVIVKSTNHFYAAFARIAREILFVDSPGALQMRFDRIPYKKICTPYWPKVGDPLPGSHKR